MKKMKRMLIGTLLVFTLCMLTACGNDNNNAADEVQNNANEDAMIRTTWRMELQRWKTWMWTRQTA